MSNVGALHDDLRMNSDFAGKHVLGLSILFWHVQVLAVATGLATIRVVSSEISSGKFPEIYSIFPEISENLLITYVNQVFPSPALPKIYYVYDKQLSRSLCFNFVLYVQKITLF